MGMGEGGEGVRTVSASRCTGAERACASSTSRTTSASMVSSPAFTTCVYKETAELMLRLIQLISGFRDPMDHQTNPAISRLSG